MALCDAILNGLSLSCTTNYGGLQKVYLASANAVSGATVDVDGEITGFTASAGTFKQYAFETAEGSDATLTINDTININARLDLQVSELVINVNKMNKALIKELEAIKNKDLTALVLDENGVWLAVGLTTIGTANFGQSLRKSAGSFTSGTARSAGDNKYTLTLKAESKGYPHTLKESAVLSVI